MNNTSRYIANLYLLLLNVRDTLEFLIPRDHPMNIYNARKLTIEESLKENSAFKNFLNNNGDKGKEIEDKFKSFVDTVYGAESTILVPGTDNVRVDHTQHIAVYDYVVGINETLTLLWNLGQIKYVTSQLPLSSSAKQWQIRILSNVKKHSKGFTTVSDTS